MNYYDYRIYFEDIIGQLDDILSADETAHNELMTEFRSMHDDFNTKSDAINTTLTNGITLISALIVLGAAVKVLFK